MGKRTIGGDKVNQLRHVRFLRDTDGAAGADGSASRDRRAEVRRGDRDASSGISAAPASRRGRCRSGGYFISLDVLDGCAKDVVRLAKEAGVELTPAGATYPLGEDPRDRNIRIAPTFPDLATVAHGCRRRRAQRAPRAATALLKQPAARV